MVTRSLRRERGFTLIELMLALTVVAILAGVAAPSVKETIARQRLRGATGKIFNDLVRARATAIKMERNVTIKATTPGAGWAGGWKIEHPTAGRDPIYIQDTIKGVTISGPDQVTFQFSGRVGAASPSWQIGVAGTSDVRCIRLELSGLPYQKSAACSS